MPVSKTLLQLRDDVKATSNHDSDAQVSDAQMNTWINGAIRDLWATYVKLGKDELTAFSSSFTIASGNTKDLATVAGDFLELRAVQQLIGSKWQRVPKWRFRTMDDVAALSYRLTGASTLVIMPDDQATSKTYRILYLPIPTALSIDGNTVVLPWGGDRYVVEDVAARVRARHEEDPGPHLAAKTAALEAVRKFLSQLSEDDSNTARDILDEEDSDGGLW